MYIVTGLSSDNDVRTPLDRISSSRSTGSKTAPHHNTSSTMLGSRWGVLAVKGLTFSPPDILLLIVANQLTFCFM